MEFNDIRCKYLTKGYWQLTADLTLGGRVIKKGFITDFGSIPGLARPWISPMDIPKPSVIHDDDLFQLRRVTVTDRFIRFDKWVTINKMLKNNMNIQGRHLSWTKKQAIYFGTNIHAWIQCIVLNNHPKEQMTLEGLNYA